MSKLRMEITKGEEIRYISHLDYARMIERSLRRAKLPIAYSEGFNPHMKMAFASALSVGVTSESEYLDVEIYNDMAAEDFVAALADQLPQGVKVRKIKLLVDRVKALMASVNLASYSIFVASDMDSDAARTCVDNFNKSGPIMFIKESPKGRREIDVKQYIEKAIVLLNRADGLQLDVVIRITPTGSIKPGEVLAVLVKEFGLAVDPADALINRTGLFVQTGGRTLSPLDFGP